MAAWGCFRLLSKPHMGERELLLFSAPAHCIGRNPERCDVVLDLQYISSVHCVVELAGRTGDGAPLVRLLDKSRNGVWVNGDRVGKGNEAELKTGYTVHFTKPGLKAQNVAPKVYKFEAIHEEQETKPELVNTTQDLNNSTLGSPVSTHLPTETHLATELSGIPDTKKRRRSSDETSDDRIDSTAIKLRKKLEDADRQLAELKAAHAGSLRALDSARESIGQLESQLKTLEEEKVQVEAAANARVEELTSKWQATAANHKKQVKVMQKQLSARDSEIASIIKDRDEAKQAAGEAEGSLCERNAEIMKLKAEISEHTRLAAVITVKQGQAEEDAALKNARQQELEAKVDALQRELDASRERISELQYAAQTSANVSATVPGTTPLTGDSTAPASSEIVAHLQRQISAARHLFAQIQALGTDGNALFEEPVAGVDDGPTGTEVAVEVQANSGLVDGEIEIDSPSPGPVIDATSAGKDEEIKTNEANEATDAAEIHDVDEAAAEADRTEQTERPQGEKEEADGHDSDPSSDKSSGSRSTTMGSADVDMEDAE